MVPSLSSHKTKVYNPKTFFLHAALLGQAFAHCPIFPTAASRRSLGRISVPMPFNLSVRLLIAALVSRYLTNQLIRREPIFQRIAPLVSKGCPLNTLCGISSRFQLLSPSERQVAHALLTRPSLSHTKLWRISVSCASFDLHVLGTPPAFILSQDQTLNKLYLNQCLHRIKSIFDRFLSSQKKLFLMSVFQTLRTLFWCLFA